MKRYKVKKGNIEKLKLFLNKVKNGKLDKLGNNIPN